MMVGALLAVSVLSVCTDWAYMPSYARVAAQITARGLYRLYSGKKRFKTPAAYCQTGSDSAGGNAVFEFAHGLSNPRSHRFGLDYLLYVCSSGR